MEKNHTEEQLDDLQENHREEQLDDLQDRQHYPVTAAGQHFTMLLGTEKNVCYQDWELISWKPMLWKNRVY